MGLLAVLLAGAAWFAAARIASLEGRVRQLESSYSRLQADHRALLEGLLSGSPEEQARAKAEMIRELRALPPPKLGKLGPAVTEVNSPPRDIQSK